ncbi:MAG: DUF421 domain-containing protein [Acidobacteriaceae bacterium]|nr:DUF421 domain-containing protein [Acidobacteriaceae bacterium]MBV9501332.1 DUF421 domain-containing protein [Acidobacteriaceae bacterium]
MAAVLRAIWGYCFLVLIVRTAGRRPGKQITPFEFVFIFFAGGVTLTSMVGNDPSLINAVTIIITIAVTHFLIAWIRHRWPAIGLIIDGTPLVLLQKGEWQVETMRRMRIKDDDVMAMARDNGLERLDQIEYAILERNGEISIIQKSENS